MENKYYYDFKFMFDFSSIDIETFDIKIEHLDIGFTYLGYRIINSVYKDFNCKYNINIKDTIELLITEFDRLLKLDDIFKYIKLDYDVMYKELESMIKDKIRQYSDLIEGV